MEAPRHETSLLNAGYLEELYERYRERPDAFDEATRAFFTERGSASTRAHFALGRLARAIRSYGHRAAALDPLGSPPELEPALALATYGLSEGAVDVMSAELVGGPLSRDRRSAREALEALRWVYCGTRGYDYGHVHDPEARDWLAETAESGAFRPPEDPIDEIELLRSLSRVEIFETFLHRMLPGKFRFSIEGLDMLVPLLQELLGEAAETGVGIMTLGMAHRGRLNVLAHVLEKPYERIIAELRGRETSGTVPSEDSGFRGDVTYHMGARRARKTGESVDLVVTLPPNPSHVEAIDPIVEGMARAAGTDTGERGAPRLSPGKTLPVLVHGDASFSGQGVVAETLNLGVLRAYRTGGTIHIIANNGLGFTTEPRELRGTRYASDVAKGFDIPVIHVNADDPEAVIEAARTSMAYLKRFRRDFVIDLIGYRRRGHNESDEPRFTQPLRYEKIEKLPTVREKWASILVERGVVSREDVDRIADEAAEAMRAAWKASAETKLEGGGVKPHPEADERSPAERDTAVPLGRLRELNRALLSLPEEFSVHPKLRDARAARAEVLAEPDVATIDWATAEELAFGTILEDGIAIRMTGEDTERGTFSHRHAVFHDVETGKEHTPLQHVPGARAAFEIANSPLTENAALGFEVGYNLWAPEELVVWEAQYGDFANGAQVVIDEFLVAAKRKWGERPSLVLLLPHGHEGHGPDHSSGRPERFLSLAADENLRIANVTTAAQYFHLLRRQSALLTVDPRPLVVFTPKGLLRAQLARSTPRALAEGTFRPVMDDPRFEDRDGARNVRRVVLVSGKLYVDLAEAMEAEEHERVPVCRLEELYPFPRAEIEEILSRYPGIEQLVWAQEEPSNMGAWAFVRERLRDILPEDVDLEYAGRGPSPSPAEGSTAEHQARQRAIVSSALGDDGVTTTPAKKEA